MKKPSKIIMIGLLITSLIIPINALAKTKKTDKQKYEECYERLQQTSEQLHESNKLLEQSNITLDVNQDFIDSVNKKKKRMVLRQKMIYLGVGLAVGFVFGGVILGVSSYYIGK